MSGSSQTAETKGNAVVRKPPQAAKRDAAAPVKGKSGNAAKSGKGKPEKLVCRYCGSDDLSPSFIKRRDRRCRKCFSKRYGSAAQAKKIDKKK